MYNILVTFDYELFLGTHSGTVANCMLRPTQHIIKVLKKHNVKAIFFVDSYYLHLLKQQTALYAQAQQDYDNIKEQILQLYKDGHYIYYHIHPHWLDAIYDPGKNSWNLPSQEKYCFSDLTGDEQRHVFESSVKALNLLFEGMAGYKQPEGFRAGGLYIEPFSIFKPYFDTYGIKYEFSVLMGAKGNGIKPEQHFNFCKVGNRVYYFSDNIIAVDPNGRFKQLALEVNSISGLGKFINKVFSSIAARTADVNKYGDGLPTRNKIVFDEEKYPSSRFNTYETFSAEGLNQYKIGLYITHLKKGKYLHLLSHPKLMSPHSIAMFDVLLGKINRLNDVNYDYKRIDL